MHVFPVTLLALSLAACSDNGSDSKKKDTAKTNENSGNTDDPSDEDLTVIPPEVVSGAYLVPVGLVTTGFLDGVIESMPKPPKNDYVTPVTPADEKHPPDSSVYYNDRSEAFATSMDYYFIEPVFTGSTQDVIVGVRDFLRQSFGADGLFNMKKLHLPAGDADAGIRNRLPLGVRFMNDPLEAVIVRVERDAPMPYIFEFYRQARSVPFDDMQRIVTLRFRPNDKTGITTQIDWMSIAGFDNNGVERFHLYSMNYDTRKTQIDIIGGFPADYPDYINASVVHYEYSDGVARYFSAWKGNSGTDSIGARDLPVPLRNGAGDLVLTRAVAKLGESGSVLYDQSFVAAGDRAALEAEKGQGVWANRNAGDELIAAIVSDLRDPQITAGCPQAGDDFNDAVNDVAASVPTSVSDLPANICRSNRNLTDAQLANALIEGCLVPGWPEFAVDVLRADDVVTTPICLEIFSGEVLRGHQAATITFDEGVGFTYSSKFFKSYATELLDRKPLSPSFAGLVPLLEGFNYFDIGGVDTVWSIDGTRAPASDFTHVKVLGE